MREWLVEIRKSKGMSQYEAARKIGIGQSMYASLETGARDPAVETAKKVGRALGFDWTRFFEGRNENGAQLAERFIELKEQLRSAERTMHMCMDMLEDMWPKMLELEKLLKDRRNT